MANAYCAIDPGKDGGAACIREERVWLLPFAKVTTPEIVDWIEDQCVTRCTRWSDTPVVIVEKVGPSPKQGTVSAFTFGGSFYGPQWMLMGLRVPFDLVTPAKWQGPLGLVERGRKARAASGETRGSTDSEKKRRHREMAQRLYPDPSILIDHNGKPGARITNAVADALLMAYFAKRRAVAV